MPADLYDVALASLYATFHAPKPRRIVGCPCCIDSRNIDILLAKPLSMLTGDDLGRYASGVFLTVGGPTDYRYLLPRILEVSATDLDWWPSPEIVVGALHRADWGHWGAAERRAVIAFLDAWFDRWAAATDVDEGGHAHGCDIEPLLCGIARAGLEVRPYLDRLLAPVNAGALMELHGMYGDAALANAKPETFWEDAPAGWNELVCFLTSQAVEQRVA